MDAVITLLKKAFDKELQKKQSDWLLLRKSFLALFSDAPFWPPWKYQKTFSFLIFSGGSKGEVRKKWVNKAIIIFPSIFDILWALFHLPCYNFNPDSTKVNHGLKNKDFHQGFIQ